MTRGLKRGFLDAAHSDFPVSMEAFVYDLDCLCCCVDWVFRVFWEGWIADIGG